MSLISSIVSSRDFHWKIFIALCVSIMVITIADSAYATAAAGGNDVIGATLCRLVQNINGSIAKSIATLAIFAVGISLFMGKLNWGTAAMTAGGVGVVFGSAKLVAWLSGSGDASECPTA
jgi:type IV secretory pathway VirB2 component (pilin)